MKPFTRAELKHLKYRLMTYDGLNEAQANKRIQELIDEVKLNHAKAKEKSRQEASKSVSKPFRLPFEVEK